MVGKDHTRMTLHTTPSLQSPEVDTHEHRLTCETHSSSSPAMSADIKPTNKDAIPPNSVHHETISALKNTNNPQLKLPRKEEYMYGKAATVLN
jgi:hypothetical protein